MVAGGPLALMIAALFTGAAFYISFAEHPARLVLSDEAALLQWKRSYKRGFLMQASLAIVGFLFAIVAWLQDSNGWWLAGGVALLANWPFTLLAIMPTNKSLFQTSPEAAGSASRDLMVRWGRLHAVRAGLGVLATAIFAWLMI